MDLLKMFEEAKIENFKAEKILEAVKQTICKEVQNFIVEKYKSSKLNRVEHSYEFFCCRASIWEPRLNSNNVEVNLFYSTADKLDKKKRAILQKEKNEYNIYGRLPPLWSNYKIPLWQILRYELDVKEVFLEEINLQIE